MKAIALLAVGLAVLTELRHYRHMPERLLSLIRSLQQ
jgi:hypothetical protein